MNDGPTKPGAISRPWIPVILGLSLMANGILGWRLVRPAPAIELIDSRPASATSGRFMAPDAEAARDAAKDGQSLAGSPPFVWSEIEHEDYRQYIANLRAVGCPEQTIRDLIAADLNQHYAARASAIWRPEQVEYWEKPSSQEPTAEQRAELRALEDEQETVLAELLGVRVKRQQLIDLLYLQVHSAEKQLLFLPEGSREAAMRALDEAGYDRKLMDFRSRSSYTQDAEEKLFAEQLQILSGVLSPAELAQFRLRHSPRAQQLRVELQYFDCTPAEFEQLLEARGQNKKVLSGDLLNRGPATEQFRELFGDERAEEFERVTDMYYQNARRAVDQAELPVDYADSAWEICRTARAAADQLADDRTLSAEERLRRLGQIRAESDRQLTQLLGEKVARPLRRDLGVVFQVAETRARQ